ncbi:leucine--tRNA ligase [Pelomyxa schiedti]|nr:leucine--tRNA ligase [Pelomyxa schiedti]
MSTTPTTPATGATPVTATATTAAPPKPASTAKRDKLTAIEKSIRDEWEAAHLHEADAPVVASSSTGGTDAASLPPKFFANFPYPYMNGLLHLGHTFTVTKAEFAVRYQKLKGKNALFPFGFHCTGMPIMACANKLREEIRQFGCPPVFPEVVQKAEEDARKAAEEAKRLAEAPAASPAPPPTTPAPAPSKKNQKKKPATPAAPKPSAASSVDPTQFHSRKVKVAQKGGKRQWEILLSNGIPPEQIPSFQDPLTWLKYFPPQGLTDLKLMGVAVDWRRSFITTEVNPFYDSFVQWQFKKLQAMDKLEFGKRPAVYSPIDKQPCADHDRSSGEGVLPQEYVAIKLELVPPFPAPLASLQGRKIFLVAGTLRPETMVGQTNCWILPEGDYGAFEMKDNEIFICTQRAAKNFSYQEMTPAAGVVVCLATLKGSDLVGAALKAPLSPYPVVYTLPMTTINPDKGTGVVTSVPSDSPDDYMNFMQLKSKPEYRRKLGVRDEWVEPFEIIPIIDVPGLGKNAAEFVCNKLKIKSPHDTQALEEAKGETYLKGFYTGKMLVGAYAGRPVQDAKPLVRADLITSKQACVYHEPASKVMSRSGDECVVALCDQWFLKYGDAEWKRQTMELMKNMTLYHSASDDIMSKTVEIFTHWGCSRSFGLGTHLPVDKQYVIESLSDSTIYMAYYTVAHLLQGGNLEGTASPLGIRPDQMTFEVWEYIFSDGELPATTIPKEHLERMRAEFRYWYPFDLRVSGKDLLSNHLVFCLYNHAAIFPNKGPKAFRANGHLLIDNEKMSKSTGNFLSLREAVDLYTADGMRIALADAGDGIDDANFLRSSADASLLKLHTQLEWIEDTLADSAVSKLADGPCDKFHDFVFESQMNKYITEADQAYQKLNFREALLHALFDLQAARDQYRSAMEELSIPLKRCLIMRYIEAQALVMAPIAPHFADHIWKRILKRPGFVWRDGHWPEAGPVDELVLAKSAHLEKIASDFRQAIKEHCTPKKRKAPAKPTTEGSTTEASSPAVEVIPYPQVAEIVVSTAFPQWHVRTIEILNSAYDETTKQLPSTAKIAPLITADPLLKKNTNKIMAFVAFMQEAVATKGRSALSLDLGFNEFQLIQEHLPYLSKIIKIPTLAVSTTDKPDEIAKLVPGKPAITFKS